MNIALWIIQGLLAFAFLMVGGMKLMKGKEALLAEMGEQMGWTEDFSASQIQMIALAEVLGALGLILPMALNILPILTPIAAVGLAIIMGGATNTHRVRHEPFIPTVVLMVLSLIVAIGRFAL